MRIIVKHGNDAKTFLVKPAIAEQCTAEIACSNQQNIPGPIGSENAADARDQVIDSVPDPRMAELPEVSQILSHLGIGQTEGLAELDEDMTDIRPGATIGFLPYLTLVG